jgi:hypothetical protein
MWVQIAQQGPLLHYSAQARMRSVNNPRRRQHPNESSQKGLASVSPPIYPSTRGDGRRRLPLLRRRAPPPTPRPGCLVCALRRLPLLCRCAAAVAPDRRRLRSSLAPRLVDFLLLNLCCILCLDQDDLRFRWCWGYSLLGGMFIDS